ncbi:MAG: hypothetical protein EPN45_20430, partial [Rhizobiaceae bacterium]
MARAPARAFGAADVFGAASGSAFTAALDLAFTAGFTSTAFAAGAGDDEAAFFTLTALERAVPDRAADLEAAAFATAPLLFAPALATGAFVLRTVFAFGATPAISPPSPGSAAVPFFNGSSATGSVEASGFAI